MDKTSAQKHSLLYYFYIKASTNSIHKDLQSSIFLQLFRNDKVLLQWKLLKSLSGAIVCQENKGGLPVFFWKSPLRIPDATQYIYIIHMKKCYHIERFPTRIRLITLNDSVCRQFEKDNLTDAFPYWFARVFILEKFKSIQCPSAPTQQSPPPETCQLAQFGRGQPSLKFPASPLQGWVRQG